MTDVTATKIEQAPSSAGAITSLTDKAGRLLLKELSRPFMGIPARLLRRGKGNGLGMPIANLANTSPERSRQVYRGEFAFCGQTLKRDETNIFLNRQMNADWQRALHGFTWLADLEASGREMSRVQARRLVSEWMEADQSLRLPGKLFCLKGAACHTDTLARRVISWTQTAPFLLHNSPQDFADRFFASITRQTRKLHGRTFVERSGLKRLQASIALAAATIGFDGLDFLRCKAFERLANELDGQILADGGHISRNPQILRDLLADLVPIRLALEAGKMEIPPALNNALERMIPALRFFTYLDGGLAVFNGVNDIRAGLVRRILDTDTVCGTPLIHARHSGYVRLQQGQTTLLVDAGKPVMPHVNVSASAGLMAFEFCDGGARLVTNCGAIQYGDAAWSAAARAPQAHSALCIEDQAAAGILDNPLSRLIFGGPVILAAPTVTAQASMSKEGSLFCGTHDGYLKSHGVTHERQLFLNSIGSDLRGQDSFTNDAGQVCEPAPFAIRFHLHPSVRATISQDGASAMLMLANKTGWRFSARGAQLKLEDSVYLPEGGKVRKTSQLVLRGATGASTKVVWAFKRIEKRKGAKPTTPTPQLF